MKTTTAILLFRVSGLLTALLGIANLCCAPAFLTDKNSAMVMLGFLFIFLGLYLLYVGYLTWRRFSPLAIRHVCGVIAFYLLAGVQIAMDYSNSPHWLTESGIVSLVCLIGAFIFYRWASKHFVQKIFGSETK